MDFSNIDSLKKYFYIFFYSKDEWINRKMYDILNIKYTGIAPAQKLF